MRSSAVLVLLALAIVPGAGCAEDDGGGGDSALNAVATTTHVADLVRNVGGERVALDGLLSADADPHDYEPRPSDAAALAEADVVFKSGGELDEWLDELVESAGGDVVEVTLLDSVERLGDDPH